MQRVVVLLLVVVMAASPSLFISSQSVASLQSGIEKNEEVSVECRCGEGVAMSYMQTRLELERSECLELHCLLL